MDARELTRWVAAARIGAGLAFAVAPRALGGMLVGADAAAPGAQLFIAAFGARDVLLGAGTFVALTRRRPTRPWLAACAAADCFDAAATVRSYRELPRGRRAVTFAVSALPAVLGTRLVGRLDA